MKNCLFTSESVTEGHPDKIADQISDAILDLYVSKDPNSHTAVETCVTSDFVMVMGEVSSLANITNDEIENTIRKTIVDIGYDKDGIGFNGNTCEIVNRIHAQSPDINQGVDRGDVIGAGDQGIMFGYATNETDIYMPLPITLARTITRQLSYLRKYNDIFDYLRPDGKSQVTVEYDNDGKPVRIDSIVISTQHSEDVSWATLRNDIINHIINDETLPFKLCEYIDSNTHIFINPTGRFVIGGPNGDSGLTGRKIIVDTYGGTAHHGGGAFSGKDCTKVDRSASYMARYIAKNIVANDLAEKCEVQLSYAIGVTYPTSILVDTFGTGKYSNDRIVDIINKNFNTTPKGIIDTLGLRKFNHYILTSKYGHFGNDAFPWERVFDLDI